MNKSILASIKTMLGIVDDCDGFDDELIGHVNAVIIALHQMGFGKDNFVVTDSSSMWNEFLTSDEEKYLQYVKQYVFLRTKMLFDPSANSTVSESYSNLIAELEWRLMLEKEDKVGENQNGSE